ncbi:MAG: S16 family serine protease [Spirochaetota bacterium]
MLKNLSLKELTPNLSNPGPQKIPTEMQKYGEFFFQKEARYMFQLAIKNSTHFQNILLAGQREATAKEFVFRLISPETALIYEPMPSFSSLCGFLSHKKWNSGAIERADKKILMVSTRPFLQDPELLSFFKTCIQEQGVYPAWLPDSTQSIRRHLQALAVSFRVFFIGEFYEIDQLQRLDPSIAELFPMRINLQEEESLNSRTLANFSNYLEQLGKSFGLKLSWEAKKAIIEYNLFLHENRESFSLDFWQEKLLLKEVCSLFPQKSRINHEEIDKSIANIQARSDKYKKKYHKSIVNKASYTNLRGSKIGLINGLSVVSYHTPLQEHGQINPISARVSNGSGSLISIEREANLSGDLHDRGVFILQNYLKGLFVNLDTIGFDVSLAFEQNHTLIDGDSASIAELLAILSALANLAIPSNIAVTGALSQYGDALPIGSVGLKIAGFVEVSHLVRRSDKTVYRLYVPKMNEKDILLTKQARDFLQAGKLQILSYTHIVDLIPEVFQVPAGKMTKYGKYPSNSLFGIIEERYERKKD